MRKLLTILFICSSFFAHAQCSYGIAQWINAYYEYKALRTRYILQVPRSLVASSCRDTAFVYYNPIDSSLHWWTGFNDFTWRADQGLGDSAHTFQLGSSLGKTGNPARFYQDREIPLNGQKLKLWDTLNNSVDSNYISFADTTSDFQHNIIPVPFTVGGLTAARQLSEFKPYNYGQIYPTAYRPSGQQAALDFTSGLGPGSSAEPGGAPDNVWGFGYNIKNGTARKDTLDGAVNIAIETNFLNNLDIVQPNFEIHCPRVYAWDGGEIRVSSYYVGKKTSYAIHETNVFDEQYKNIHTGRIWKENFLDNGGELPHTTWYGQGTPGATFDAVLSFIDLNGAEERITSIASGGIYLGAPGTPQGIFANQFNRDGTVRLCASASTDPTSWKNALIGTDSSGAPIDPTARLEVRSDRSGFLPPRLTTVQKLAIASPTEGLQVYDKTLHQMSYYNGTTWVNF
jgi:hypothetical protein